MVDYSWSYARLNWSLGPVKAFVIKKQISVSKLGCQHLQLQDKCVSCLSTFMCQGCASVSEKGGSKAGMLVRQAELQQALPEDANVTGQIFRPWIWLAGILIN